MHGDVAGHDHGEADREPQNQEPLGAVQVAVPCELAPRRRSSEPRSSTPSGCARCRCAWGCGRASRSSARCRPRAARRRNPGPAARGARALAWGARRRPRGRGRASRPGCSPGGLVVAAIDEVDQSGQHGVGAVAALVGQAIGEGGGRRRRGLGQMPLGVEVGYSVAIRASRKSPPRPNPARIRASSTALSAIQRLVRLNNEL